MITKSISSVSFALCLVALGTSLLTSCSVAKTPGNNFLYFQNNADSIRSAKLKERVIVANDVLSIQVTSQSLNQDQVAQFNSVNGIGSTAGQTNLVAIDGTIDMPVIKKTMAAGLTKNQLEVQLADKLSPFVKDVSVRVRFLQFKVNILGEVKNPGVHNFDGDYTTIIDAISAAGDLTENGKRNDIMVIREDSAERKFYQVDLRSASLFQSPAYQLQPNDIVYVGANDKKIERLNRNDHEGQKSWAFFLSVVSVATTTAFIVYSTTK